MNMQNKLLIGLLAILFILYAENLAFSQETKSVQKKQQAVNSNLPTHQQIISEAQRSVDRSLTIMDRTISAIGVLVGLLTLIILVLGGLAAFFGIKEYRSWKKVRDEFQEKIELQAKSAKTDADKIKDILGKHEAKYKEAEETLSKVKPIVDKIAKYEKDINGIKEKYENEFRNLSITEKPSGETKDKLDEFTKKSEFLEGVGVELDPDNYINRGLDYYYKGEYKKAEEVFVKATVLKPDYVSAWVNRGAALNKLGKHKEAVKSLDKAIELKPDAVKAWDNKGNAFSKLGEYDEAIKHYDKAIELQADNANALYNKACTYSLKGGKEQSLENLQKAVALDQKYKEMSKKDEDFKNLWDDEDFKKIVE
jgi:tetratricopeptide (TPR) repeat protein